MKIIFFCGSTALLSALSAVVPRGGRGRGAVGGDERLTVACSLQMFSPENNFKQQQNTRGAEPACEAWILS